MAKEKEKQVQRVFGTEKEVISDTFKLSTEKMKKNLSWNDKKPVLDMVDHQHIFHTYTSSGKKNLRCSAVGGHTHSIEVKEENGDFEVIVGPAMGVDGKSTPLNDTHTHTAIYLRSDKMNLKKKDQDAMAFIANQANKWASADKITDAER